MGIGTEGTGAAPPIRSNTQQGSNKEPRKATHNGPGLREKQKILSHVITIHIISPQIHAYMNLHGTRSVVRDGPKLHPHDLAAEVGPLVPR